MDVGKRIKIRRKQAGLTLKKMSDLVGISASFLSDIENGRSRPSLKRLEGIAEALKTSVSWLMGEKSLKEPSPEYQLKGSNATLRRLMSFPEFKEVIDCLKDFPEWDKSDREELIGYLKAKKLFRDKKKDSMS